MADVIPDEELATAYPLTKELVCGHPDAFADSWWVNVNGETIPQPTTLDEAKSYRPKGSRVKILLLHTSLQDEWIPIAELEKVILLYAYDPKRDGRVNREVEEFRKSLSSSIDWLWERGGLVVPLTQDQIQKISRVAEIEVRKGRHLDPEKIIKKQFPENFDPLLFSEPDLYEDATGYLEYFDSDEFMFLFWKEDEPIVITDVLSNPTVEQLIKALKDLRRTSPNWDDCGDDSDESKAHTKLAKKLGKLYPELIKDTPRAQRFFSASPRKTANSGIGKKAGSPPTLIQIGKNEKGEKSTTINISVSQIIFLFVLLAFCFFFLKGCIG